MAMIRAAIGRVILHCIDQAKRRKTRAIIDQLDPATMTDQQISDLLHGRPIRFTQPGILHIVEPGNPR